MVSTGKSRQDLKTYKPPATTIAMVAIQATGHDQGLPGGRAGSAGLGSFSALTSLSLPPTSAGASIQQQDQRRFTSSATLQSSF
jgi:hypothetical protein